MARDLKRKIISGFAVIAIAALLLVLLQLLFMPKHMSEIYEGALIREYYTVTEREDHDLIFIGDCEVYESFSPQVLWDEFGIPSYIVGSAQQLIWHSYYLLEDVFRRDKPKVVVFSVLAMKFDEPQREAYNRMNIDGMPLSFSKLASAWESLTEGEDLLTYVFPLLRFHDRWADLRGEDFRYLFSRRRVAHNGYLMRVDVKPAGYRIAPAPLADYAFGERSWAYLDRIRELCARNGAELILIKAPSLSPPWYPEWDAQIKTYARAHQLLYVNYLDDLAAVGLDMSQDTYDAGLHLNLAGAEKLARAFGRTLRDNTDLPDRRDDPELAELWQKKGEFYAWMKADQERELAEFGEVRSYIGRPLDQAEP